MSLHPQAQALIDAFAEGPLLNCATLTCAEFRARIQRAFAGRGGAGTCQDRRQDHSPEIGGDAARVAVAGDSSGGNFAAVIAQTIRIPLCMKRRTLHGSGVPTEGVLNYASVPEQPAGIDAQLSRSR